MKDCSTCDYKKYKDKSAWCYFYKKEPERCQKWRPLPIAKKSTDR